MVTWRQLTQLTSSYFQVSLVPKVTQIIYTTVTDPFLHVIDTFLLNLYFTEMV